MIRLKDKVNKTQVMKELSDELAKQLDGTYEPEYSARLCMIGAEMLFKKLRLPHVINNEVAACFNYKCPFDMNNKGVCAYGGTICTAKQTDL